MVPQDLPLQNSPPASGDLLSHGVKEESDMEPELGEGQLSVVLCGGLWGNFGGYYMLKETMTLEGVDMTRVCILKHSVVGLYHLSFGSLEGAWRNVSETVWKFGGARSC